jgi:spore coat polysaccharide biosynthesis predicted glycosyltransferase SpsG/CTP:molybdopterin cytidylyltransferase MocA
MTAPLERVQSMASGPEVWLLVPARGGSKEIPRKNLRLLAGKPLIRHVLEELGRSFDRDTIVVSTDDAEIAGVAEPLARIHERRGENATDRATLDQVAVEVASWLLEEGAHPDDYLLTLQPTSPFLSVATVRRGIELLAQGAKSVVSVRDDRHLRWTRDEAGRATPLFAARVNRQWLPPTFAETGGLIGARLGDVLATGTRVLEPVALIELDAREGLDIDSHADWAAAEFHLRRKRIAIRADASPLLGMGHVYRAVALANEMTENEIRIATLADEAHALGARFLAERPHPVQRVADEASFLAFLEQFRPHIAILDVLDTSQAYVREVKARAGFVISLEDLGPGSRVADLVINDLYTDFYPQANHWYGVQYALLAPQFDDAAPAPFAPEVGRILVAFGGTDQHDLTAKALAALQAIGFAGEVLVVLGPGYAHGPVDVAAFGLAGRVLRSVPNMAQLMRQAHLAITSAGRTVTELMTLGVPTVALSQNLRELRHTHASSPFGVMNLGLGEHVDVQSLASHVSMIIGDRALREDMRSRALASVRDRSNRALVRRILEEASAALEREGRADAR